MELAPSILTQIEDLTQRYPTRLAALLPALHLVQQAYGCVSPELQQQVAKQLDVPVTRVHEAVTFYTMFRETKEGRHHVRICHNLACQLRGADALLAHAEQYLGIQAGQTTADGRITLQREECLASCGTAPMLWHNDTLLENVTIASLETFLKELS